MIDRRVTSTRIPYLPITVEIPEQHLTVDLMALVDTSFNAEVVVPADVVASGASALLETDVRLADGSRITVPGYLGIVTIGATTISPVLVIVMGDEAIIALEVITRFRLTLDHDATLTVEP